MLEIAPTHSPVFVIGSPRSGTSALVDALFSVGYHGFREGNLLPLLPVLAKTIDRHWSFFGKGGAEVLVSNVDPEKIKAKIAFIFKDVVDALNPTAPWMDKSGNPEMIEAIPFLLTLWPDSRFIFAKRRALENIVSRMQKFPGNFEYHCRDWAKNMETWRHRRQSLPADCWVEIDQQDMIRKPEACAAHLAGLLNLSVGQRDTLSAIFARSRPQQTAVGTAQRVLSLDATWNEHQRQLFKLLCGPEMKAYGYSLDETYWQQRLDE